MQQTRRPWCGVIMILALAGCADDVGIGEDESAAPDGVRVYCVGDGQQWATWDPGNGQWLITDADNLETCIGLSNVWGPDEAPFTFDEWTTHLASRHIMTRSWHCARTSAGP